MQNPSLGAKNYFHIYLIKPSIQDWGSPDIIMQLNSVCMVFSSTPQEYHWLTGTSPASQLKGLPPSDYFRKCTGLQEPPEWASRRLLKDFHLMPYGMEGGSRFIQRRSLHSPMSGSCQVPGTPCTALVYLGCTEGVHRLPSTSPALWSQ